MTEGNRRYERDKERYEHQEKASKITDPQFIALKKRLINFLGYITHEYCGGGPFGNEWYTGRMGGISSAIKIMEHVFIDAMETKGGER